MRRFAPAFVLAVRRLCLAVLAFSMKAGGGVADGGSVVRGRLTLNPETISHVQCVELKIFDMMISAGPVILILSKLARMFRPYVIACLHKEFADIRIQLRLSENGGRPAGGRPRGGRQPAFTQKAVAVLCGRSEGKANS